MTSSPEQPFFIPYVESTKHAASASQTPKPYTGPDNEPDPYSALRNEKAKVKRDRSAKRDRKRLERSQRIISLGKVPEDQSFPQSPVGYLETMQRFSMLTPATRIGELSISLGQASVAASMSSIPTYAYESEGAEEKSD